MFSSLSSFLWSLTHFVRLSPAALVSTNDFLKNSYLVIASAAAFAESVSHLVASAWAFSCSSLKFLKCFITTVAMAPTAARAIPMIPKAALDIFNAAASLVKAPASPVVVFVPAAAAALSPLNAVVVAPIAVACPVLAAAFFVLAAVFASVAAVLAAVAAVSAIFWSSIAFNEVIRPSHAFVAVSTVLSAWTIAIMDWVNLIIPTSSLFISTPINESAEVTPLIPATTPAPTLERFPSILP